MVFDPYEWSKKRIAMLIDEIESIKDDGLNTAPGQIWSIKKLLVLDYYMGGFVKIMRNRPKFDNWIYVDTHCGSGLIGFEDELADERFPGSPIIAALRSISEPFTRYLVSDINGDSIKDLTVRIKKLMNEKGTLFFTPVVRDFEKTVVHIETQKKIWNVVFGIC